MQFFKARYIYPVSSAPIHNGIIAINGERIAAVGSAEAVMQQYPGANVLDLGAVMLLPQAVTISRRIFRCPGEGHSIAKQNSP